MSMIFYYFILLFELVFLMGISVFLASLLYSSIKGAPYVPTKKKEITRILEYADFQEGQNFLELGCGDGRVAREAVKRYGVTAVGIDINPVILLIAKLKSRWQNIRRIYFYKESVFNTDIKNFDVIYLFLMPEMLDKLAEKLKKEAKQNTLIISHGFKIQKLTPYLVKTLSGKLFPTYYYKIRK